MAREKRNLIYALQNENIVHISEVSSGLSCNCICPYCKTKLIARKGIKNSHHFAHYNSELCDHGYETALHLAAKEIILKAKKIRIPEVKGNRGIISKSKYISVDNVKLEKRVSEIIPDIIVESNGKELFIEIFVTHAVDKSKLRKIKRLGTSTIEVYLGDIDGNAQLYELENIIVHELDKKKWLYNSYAEDKDKELSKNLKRININDGKVTCPLTKHKYGELHTVNYDTSCFRCRFFSGYDKFTFSITCRGEGIAVEYSDLSLTIDERLEKYKITKSDYPRHGLCPYCGKDLTIVRTKKGLAVGCTGYPECDYYDNSIDRKYIKLRLQNKCPNCGGDLTKKKKRNTNEYFIGCVNFPKCEYRENVHMGVMCPECGGTLTLKSGKFGAFYACTNYPECEYTQNAKINKDTGEIYIKQYNSKHKYE